jgi:DNA-directed RNA polymerase specialized sigma subunit
MPIRIPERQLLDRRHVENSSLELTDKLGREPSDDELADYTSMSIKRIRKVRGINPPMMEGFFASLAERGEEGGFTPSVQNPDSAGWFDLVYQDLDPIDQKIVEYTMGLNGQPKMSNKEIAAKLNRSPGLISQRKAAIQAKLDQESELSPFGG